MECYVVERIEWDEDLDAHQYWEDRSICRVLVSLEEAKAFCEDNSAETIYPMRWRGSYVYSGRTVADGQTEEGLIYNITKVPLHTGEERNVTQ